MYAKNKVMNMLCLITVLLSFIVFALHQYTHLIPVATMAGMEHNSMTPSSMEHIIVFRYILLAVPLALLLWSALLFRRQPNHSYLPVINTLVLTLGSIGLIAAGNGLVEYHFSVFMVVAFIAFYDSIALILLSTAIFAFHHLAGFFLFPELLCGEHAYSFSLLLIHAIFLLLTSGAAILIIVAKKNTTQALQSQNDEATLRNHEALFNLQHTEQYMEQSAGSLRLHSQSLMSLSEHIAKAIQLLRTQASDELLPSQQVSEQQLIQVADAIYQIAASLEQLNQSSTTTLERAQIGQQSLTQITDQVSSLQIDVHDMASGIHAMSDQSYEIARFVDIIANLAEQTNLLALNASIEAARAGEHGQSFAVVAQEVKKLSLETSSALKMISSIISEFSLSTTSAIQSSERGAIKMQETLKTATQAHSTFGVIVTATEETNLQIAHMSSQAQSLNGSAEKIGQSMSYVTHIIQDSMQSHEAVNLTVQQQLENTRLVNEEADHLNQMSDKLGQLVHNLQPTTTSSPSVPQAIEQQSSMRTVPVLG